MRQQQIETPTAPCGRLVNALFGASVGDQKHMISILDEAIPLQDTSHADVVEYVVEIPFRYAECFGLLADGRKIPLREPRKFVGWSRHDRDRSLLFRSNGKHFEVAVEAGLRGHAPGSIREVLLEAKSERRSSQARKFIGIDGDLVILPVLPTAP